MALSPVELVELRMLERGRVVGSDGRDWLRFVVGIALTALAILAACLLTQSGIVGAVVGILGATTTALWTVHAGRKAVDERIAQLRSHV